MMKKAQAKKPNKLLRVVLPALLVLAWLGMAAVGGPYFGKIKEVSSNDMSSFLPASAESTLVKDELEKFQDNSAIPAIVVFESSSQLSSQQARELRSLEKKINQLSVVKGDEVKAVDAKDRKAAFMVVPLDNDLEASQTIGQLKKVLKESETSLDYKLTGPAMFSKDLNTAFAGIDGTLLVVALVAVFVILLAVYRSPILPVITLLGSTMALSGAVFVVWHLAKAGVVQINGQVQGILFILVIGAATDYALLYIARYREELTAHKDKWQATWASWKASWEPIVAAGSTVTLGLLCLLVSDLESNKALGPVGGIGIAFAILSALSFLPASLFLLGRNAFWPRRPSFDAKAKQQSYQKNHPVWARISQFVEKHPRKIWLGVTAGLVVLCLFLPQLKADGISQENLVLGESEARDGQAMLDRHFSSGAGSPASVLVPQEQQGEVVEILEADAGVDSISVLATGGKSPSMPVGKQREEVVKKAREQLRRLSQAQKFNIFIPVAYAMPAEVVERYDSFAGMKPKVRDGRVVLQATLKYPADSIKARQTVERLRGDLKADHPTVKIGGLSAIQLDTNNASERDLHVIIPVILLAITIVLMLLLRAVIAPLVLLATTVLSFGAALGLSALLFNHLWHYPGADPAVVIFGFVFLVALGIDYNIFLMSRVREETARLGVKAGVLKALTLTGGVITSAGLVLAATFAALYVIPILFLAQIAFIVAFGVLLDTLIVRSLLVPALTLEIGRFIWWPSKLWRGKR